MGKEQDRPEEQQKPTAGAVELTETELESAQGGTLSAAAQKVRAAAYKIADGSVKVAVPGDGSV